ncbi:MAG: CpaF family protein [Planctomycetes bacterium]|nr:CpaF family protein [Planctomycetota bacterium]
MKTIAKGDSSMVKATSVDATGRLHQEVLRALDLGMLARWDRDRLREEVRRLARHLAGTTGTRLDDASRDLLADRVVSETFGLGPLDEFMTDPDVNDILVNGASEIWVDRQGVLSRTGLTFRDDAHLLATIQRILAPIGRRVDEASPTVDARLPDGSRVHALLPPLSLQGPVLSVRRFGRRLNGEGLLANGTLPNEALEFLSACVKGRLSILVSGGTGAGKTTLLNALSASIPHGERVVTIEDSAELRLEHPHVVRLETRQPCPDGKGEVSPRELVRNSLRMRPDRILLGEARGAEAFDLLQAMNTGHEGSLATVHANDAREALMRLEMMVLMAGIDLPLKSVRSYITAAVRVVVHMARLHGGSRRVLRICELRGIDSQGDYRLEPVFEFRQEAVRDGRAIGRFRATGEVPESLEKLGASGIELARERFAARWIEASGAEGARHAA